MKTILVVEDDLAIRDLLGDFLDNEGYHVLLAGNGQQGLEQLLATKPDLVVSDLMMPVLTGIDLAKAVRSDPRYRQLPLIAISGALQPDRDWSALFTTFVAKPFRLMDLLAAVERCIGPVA